MISLQKKYGVLPISKYKEFIGAMPVCCVDVVIHVGRRFLLIKRLQEPAKGEWWFPGGRIFKYELLTEGVIRKTREETGLEVNVEKQIGAYDTIFDTSSFGIPVHTVNVAFLVTPTMGSIEGICLDSYSSEYTIVDSVNGCNDYVIKIILDSGVMV